MRKLYASAVASAVVLTLSACGGDEGPQTFEEEPFPFTFIYPGDWEIITDLEVSESAGSAPDTEIAVAQDEDNLIILQIYTLNVEVTDQNLSQIKPEFDGVIAQIAPDAEESTETEVDGLPALEVNDVGIESDNDLESRIVSFFEGDTQYFVNCQSTPDGREAVEAACQEAIDTLQLTG